MTVKLRYKKPNGDKSILLEQVIKKETVSLKNSSQNFKWSAAVAGFGMLLRDSDFKDGLKYKEVIALARSAKGTDDQGYRSELIKLMETVELLVED